MKKQVLLRAPLLTNSGYGVHSRQIFEWLYDRDDIELKVECLQWGRTSWLLDENEENGIVKKIMDCSKPFEKENMDISFQVQLPDEWDTTLAKINIGVSALVETDKCSQEWVDQCNKMDHVIVPSTFTKNVLKRSGQITTNLSVIQEWFNPILLNRSKNDKTLNDERFKSIDHKFNILMIGTLTSQNPNDDRKNLLNSLKWICEEFKGNEDVCIVLKTNLGKGTTIDRKDCVKFLKSFKYTYGVGDYPKIKLLHGNMTKEEVSALFNHKNVKLYATATRGEGYGLPLIEAAASGLPIVATGWSGHLEFLDKELIGSVDYNLVNISKTRADGRIFKEDFRWAEPVESSFKREIRKVYENFNDAKDKAKKLEKEVRYNFNSKAIKQKYDKLLIEYLEK